MDLNEIENELKELSSENEIENYVNNIHSGLIVDIINGYSDDYKILRSNWHQICQVCNVSPKKIITVSKLPDNNDKDFNVIHMICDTLSSMGYLIRRDKEIIKCAICGGGLLCEDLYNMFKSRGSPHLPSEWSNTCSSCSM